MARSNTGIPGVSFSWRRAIGLSRVESEISRKTGIPLTRAGRERKMGRIFIHMIGWLLLAGLIAIGYYLVTHPDVLNAIIGAFKR